MRAFIFPGQGSQAVGMGTALAAASGEARAVFEEVDDALGDSLFKLMSEGPEDRLTLTENAQPAIMANAIATLAVLASDGVRLADKADYVAGHSLGEYSALHAAEAFDLATTARLLRLRGQAMQAAVPVGQGAMAVLLGLDFEQARAVAEEAAQGEVCEAANDNGGGQVVVSGHTAAVERAIAIAKGKGAKRAMLLPVSAPFHCRLMQPAAEAMAEALGRTALRAPLVPVYANVTAAPAGDPDEIRDLLVRQVTGTVRWRESVEAMFAAGVHEFVEFGGKVLGPMVRRIAPDAKVTSVVTMDDIEALAKEILSLMFDLTGMTALVTGASGGIGSAIAEALAAQGARLALSGTREEKLREVAASIGGDPAILPCDLSDGAAVDQLVPRAVEALGGLDILVNNAGITRDGLAMRMKDDDWSDVIKVNLEAAFRLARAACRPMMKARFGRIISIGSVVGTSGNPGQANYAAAKAGLIGMSKALAQELASRGITVNTVAPGLIATAMTEALSGAHPEAMSDRIPAGRQGEPSEVAAAVVYLASREAGYVTGQTLHVNGGLVMV